MEKQKKIIILMIILVILLAIGFFIIKKLQKEERFIYENEDTENIINNNETIEELKKETGADGNTQIYEVQTEYDGRKVLAIKADLKYKVALAGMLKGTKPTYNELDEIITANAPKDTGIWVSDNSREKVTKFLEQNSFLKSKYYIDNNGYIKVENKNNQSDIDKRLEKLINSDNQYIINISSVCYIVDSITGEILDYNFEKMDKFQTYQYFQDDKLMILFVNENSNSQLTNDEIFESVIGLIA